MAEIIIDFDLDGEVHMEGKGFQGKSCDEAMGANLSRPWAWCGTARTSRSISGRR